MATHSETGEKLVIYQALYGDFAVYARELSMFLSEVDRQKYPNASQTFRFEKVSAPSNGQSAQTAETQFPAQSDEKQMRSKTLQSSGDSEEVADGAVTEMSATTGKAEAAANAADADASGLDPLVLEFLDADSYEKRLEILSLLRGHITDDIINTLAAATDLEIPEGEVEDRYAELQNCLLTLERFECNRLR